MTSRIVLASIGLALVALTGCKHTAPATARPAYYVAPAVVATAPACPTPCAPTCPPPGAVVHPGY